MKLCRGLLHLVLLFCKYIKFVIKWQISKAWKGLKEYQRSWRILEGLREVEEYGAMKGHEEGEKSSPPL